MPASVRAEIEADGYQLQHLLWPEPPIDAAHVFVTDRADLEAAIARLRPLLAPAGFLWISWPKKAARVPTDITEDVIREVALPDRPGRREGLRGRRDLVGPQARDPQGIARHG